jgi:hypothetical protein
VSEDMKRNEIFATAKAHGLTSNIMKDDFGMEIPVDTVPIPSNGVTYNVDTGLAGMETIDIRAMTAREEDILTSRALIKKGTVINELIKSCVVDKNINVEKMLVGDRNAVMIAVRITGYGAEYKAEVACPACGEKDHYEFDLTSLPIKRLSSPPVSPGENCFEVTLPMSKKKVLYKLFTGEDEREQNIIAERKKKLKLSSDSLITDKLAASILSVGGIQDKNKINHFVRNMPARDSLFLRNAISENEPGVEMKSWMECNHCQEHSEVSLPLGASFFWPDS